METIKLTALGIILLWAGIINAQPEINQAEKHDVGTTSSFFSIDTGTISNGASGANIMWDFTQVTATGQTYGEQYILPSQTEWEDSFATATLSRKATDGSTYFIRDKNDSVWLEGLWLDYTKILLRFSKPQQILTRPLHYTDSYLGTTFYTYTYQNTKYRGGGAYQYNVDGYGELKLQSGTYPSVLRLKFESDYYDTMQVSPNIITRTHSTTYYWYNPFNPSPIVQLSTVAISSANFNTVNKYAYILKNPSTAVQQINNANSDIKVWVNNDNLYVEGLNSNNMGDIKVYDITGKQIVLGSLQYTDGVHSTKLNTALSKGVYIVNMALPQGNKTIKIAIL